MSIAPEITAIESPYLSSTNTGLGNCLFQIASTYGLGKKYNKTVFYDRVIEFGYKLNILYKYNHFRTIFRNFTTYGNCSCTPIQETVWRGFDTQLIDTISKHTDMNYRILGHLEVPQYFKEYTDDLRILFSPDDESRNYLETTYPFLFDSRPTVAVHIRSYSELSFSNALLETYYHNAIAKIEEHVSNPNYIVFTDTLIDKINFLEGKTYTIIKNTQDYLDLWCMMACKHYILSQSTFSYWGWFLNANNDKHTVVPIDGKLNFYDGENVYMV